MRRGDMRRASAQFRFSPRPRASKSDPPVLVGRVRSPTSRTAAAGSRRGTGDGEFAIEFQNSDRFAFGYSDTYEFLPLPFPIAPGVTLPVGGYDFASVRAGFNLGPAADRSRATCRSSTARSTTATRPRSA